MTLMEGLVVVVVTSVFVALIIPWTNEFHDERIPSVLSNAKQIHQAAYRMALDNAKNPRPYLGWPGDLAQAAINPISSTGEYVERLVEYKYLDRRGLVKLFGGPGVPAYSGTGTFEGANSVFNIYKIRDGDLDTALFLATKNFSFGAPLDETKPPGKRGAVIVRKGGDAQLLSAKQAMDRNVGVMPGGSNENPGVQEGNVLKD